ncbi:MAG: protein-export membrane protein SecF [Candidatus Chisholmbacteria bacterium RIFCSPHIGHO2_01_FULL_49_18]|uniref:Protein-export membrane protein SecF n=2 Tax=Candidatus Chisholmiibacteriota TaxID=1817900 RepID=A0A1G1VPJ0_9BACT|nr:MAG: protein-export membrane protein SecF [Candidatus Chisholmbacteria bacterium RIFCSPHIGHO2_01_FULL_49_18]OGY20922.1 MAG: protein-export membrane protein SecF [Candidatus Chisholmbacteria bacterium RIFCSPLOWO2_01_FULL_49_14]
MQFMRYKILYFSISLIVLVPSLISLILFGVKPAIDFTGGALLEVSMKPMEGKEINETSIREAAGEEFDLFSIQKTGEGTVLIRSKPLSQEKKSMLIDRFRDALGEVEEVRFETVGPTIGAELLRKTITAIIIAAILILLYVAYRFREFRYGVCAILAMFHDTFIVLGVFSLLGHFANIEVDTLFVTALLTTLSFSVHDTIVVYDRIRESLKRHPKAAFEDIVNLSVAETLGRSVNNSLTIIFMLVALFLLGGVTTRWFVLALLIGTISGTYSSTFTAAPLLVVWENWLQRRKKK